MNEASLIPTQVTLPKAKHLLAGRTFQGIPSITCTAGNRLLACWYSGGEDEGPENFVMIVFSDDQEGESRQQY